MPFCSRCGSHLWFNDVEEGGQPSRYELMPGLFDAARSWPLRPEIYVDRAMASVVRTVASARIAAVADVGCPSR